MHIRDANLCVVERGQNIGNADADVFGVLGLDDLFCAGVLTQKFSRRRCRRNNCRIRRLGRPGNGSFRGGRAFFRRFFFVRFGRGLFVGFGRGFFSRFGRSLFSRSGGSGFRLGLLFFGSGFLFFFSHTKF